MIAGIIAGYAADDIFSAVWQGSKEMHVIGVPGSIGAGKVTKVTFISFSSGAAVSNANITLSGVSSEHGATDEEGVLVLAVNATTNGSIDVNAEKSGYKNATFIITSTPGLDISASPASITSGIATYVTFSVAGMGKPIDNAAINLSGAGVALDGITGFNGQIILLVNPPSTGKITATARKTGYIDGSTAVTSASQQTLSVSSSHSTLTVNVPVYVTFTVTAGGSAVSDAVVSLSGGATGSGITNRDGKSVILTTPSSTGTITASASKNGFAGSSTTITSANTQPLYVASTPTSITAGVPTYVMFTVTSGNNAVSEAAVALTGAVGGNGVTNQNGQAILLVNSSSGTITASASKTGYSGASTMLSVSGQPTLSVSANPSSITNGVNTYVTFTVTSGGSAVSGAAVSVSGGGIVADGMTSSAGQATLQLNATGSTAISVTARKMGFVDGAMTLAH